MAIGHKYVINKYSEFTHVQPSMYHFYVADKITSGSKCIPRPVELLHVYQIQIFILHFSQ